MDLLRDVRKIVAPYVGPSGMCAEEQEVVDSINEARRILYEIGDWKDTTEPICVKPYCGTITLPPHIDYAKRAFLCCQNITVINDWFSHLHGDFDACCGRSCGIFRQEGSYVTFRDWPKIPQSNPCCPEAGFKLKLVFESDRDKDVNLTFYGHGVNKQNVKIERSFGAVWKDNLPLPGESPLLSLTRVIKPKTDGRIRVYGYDGDAANPTNEFLLAVYEGDWVNPQFTRYTVPRVSCGVVMKAKKKYVPLVNEDEFVDIHVDALIHALQAMAERRARNNAGYMDNLKAAVDFLNRQLAGPESTSCQPVQMSPAYRVEGLI